MSLCEDAPMDGEGKENKKHAHANAGEIEKGGM